MSYGYQPYGYQPSYGNPNYMQRGYAPQTPQMPQSQPQMQMQAQIPQQSPIEMPIQDIKYVNRAQADAYIVFPNTKVMLIDRESGMVYIKAADGMGQSQTEYFRFEPINADGTPIKPQEAKPEFDIEEFGKRFVTIEQYEALVQQISELKKSISNNRNNQSKGNNG
jgi:hypothetical protein